MLKCLRVILGIRKLIRNKSKGRANLCFFNRFKFIESAHHGQKGLKETKGIQRETLFLSNESRVRDEHPNTCFLLQLH